MTQFANFFTVSIYFSVAEAVLQYFCVTLPTTVKHQGRPRTSRTSLPLRPFSFCCSFIRVWLVTILRHLTSYFTPLNSTKFKSTVFAISTYSDLRYHFAVFLLSLIFAYLSVTEFTILWRTIIRHGGCRLSVCVSVCPGANFATG